jgi:hypothetical protein
MFPPNLPGPLAAPDPMGAPAPSQATPVVKGKIPLSEQTRKRFRQQIDLALAHRKHYEPWWEANVNAYAPKPGQSPTKYAEEINTNRDFTLVERKKADLYYQRAEMTLQPTPLMDGPILGGPPGPDGQPTPLMGPPDAQGQAQPVLQAPSLQAHEEIVNELRGPDGVNAKRVIHQALFDVLCPSGIGFTKFGYDQHSVLQTVIDPLTGLPRDVPVPVKQEIFWHYVPPKQALIPHNFRSTDWDRAPWLGLQFTLPLTKGHREKYQLPEDFQGSKPAGTEQHFDYGLSVAEGEQVFTGVELEYRSILFRDDIVHPDHLTHLVLVDGIDEPVIHEDSPHQTLDEKGGLTPDSLIGYSIHPLNVRMMTDTAYPPSDCTMIRPLVNELNIYRSQSVQFRDAVTLKWMYNTDTLPPDAVAKIVRAPIGGMIGVPPEAFLGDGAIKELPHGSIPRDTHLGEQAIDADISRTGGVDAAGAGVQSQTSQTATSAQIQQGNANARLDFERGVVLDWDCKGVTKFSTLIIRYLPVTDAAKIVGHARAQAWDVWRKQVNSALAFTALPDSALRTDQAADRKSGQELYSFLANDPFVNRQELLTSLLRKFHLDPAKIVKQPEPPKPEPPKLALSFKGEDLIGPMAPIVIEILTQQGLKISPEAVTQSQGMLLKAQQLEAAQAQEAALVKAETRHGGKVAQQESLSKHASDESGAMQGLGGPPATLGPGGSVM